MWDKIANILTRYRIPFFLLVCAMILLSLFFVREIPVNGKLDGFYMTDHPYYESFEKISEFTPYKHIVQIQLPIGDCTLKQLFYDIGEMVDSLHASFTMAEAYSLYTSREFILRKFPADTMALDILPAIRKIPVIGESVSEDGAHLMILLHLEQIADFDLEVFNEIIYRDYSSFGKPAVMSGPHIEAEIARSIRDDLIRLSLVISLFICLIVLLIYRSIIPILVIAVNTIFSLFPLVLLFNLLNIQLNIISLISFPVVLILSVADSIHLINGYYHFPREGDRSMRIEKVISRFLVPSFLTSLTTAIAFISFTFNDSIYIREFGILVSLGVLFEFVVTFLTLPFLMALLNKGRRPGGKIGTFIDQMMHWKKAGSVTLIMLMLASLFFIPHLSFLTDYDSFYPVKSQLRKDHAEIDEHFQSLVGLDILISKKEGVEAKVNIKQMTVNLVSELKNLQGVKRVSSYRDRIDFQMKYTDIFYKSEIAKLDKLYLSDKSSKIHVSVSDPEEIKGIILAFKEIAKEQAGDYEIIYYSPALLFDYINERVARSLLRSVLFSLLLLILIFALLARNLRNTLVCTIANLVPMAILVITFVVLGIDINIGTAITAVICLGLIVDDSIHIVYCRIILNKELGYLSHGLLTTSLILAGSFLLFVLSDFKPTRIFGSLSAMVFLVTFVSDMFILNWLLKKKSKNSGKEILPGDQDGQN